MSKTLTNTELKTMENRFRKINQDSAIREYRRTKAKTKAAPGIHPESQRSQLLVKQIKDATKKNAPSPTEALTNFIREAATRLQGSETDGAAKPEKYLILDGGSKGAFLMLINELGSDTIFATGVNGDGAKILGSPMVSIKPDKTKETVTLFGSLDDALAYSKMNDVALVTL